MSDISTSPPQIPTVAQSLIHDFAQKVLTTIATSLVAGGAFAPGDAAKFSSIGAGIVVYAASCLWTYAAVKVRVWRQHQLLAAEPKT